MGLIIFGLIWLGSLAGLVFLPFNTGVWLIMAIVAGVMSLYLGFGLGFAMNMDSGYWYWYLYGWVCCIGGAALALYGLGALIWRGAGISVDVNVQDVRQ